MLSLAAGIALAGCSADVIRLDSPASFGFNDKQSVRPAASMSRAGAGSSALPPPDQAYTPPPPNNSGGVKMAALPDAAGAQPSYQAPAYTPPPAAAAAPATPRGVKPAALQAAPAPTASAERGEAITVKGGDTLFGLSKKYHASVAELMSVNGLTSPNLKPGQTLYLPAGKNASKKPLTRTQTVAAAPAVTPPAPDVLAKYNGSYTVKKGDSLYALSLQMKVPLAELQQVNGITDVRKVRPGAVLKVPATSALASAAPASAAAGEPQAKVPAAVVQAEAGRTAPAPVLLNAKVAAASPTQTDATAPQSDAVPAATVPAGKKGMDVAAAGAPAAGAAALPKLRWPAKGKIIGTFGPRPDGTHNDGVNLAVPQGTEVHAAENGTVAYAGSELKGYGNLILVRHDNGWITAYAHNEDVLVKRGDKVKRGQVISKAGKSGQVDSPQVHFELRQGSEPVDPTPYMEKL